jgi:hypothetical protein
MKNCRLLFHQILVLKISVRAEYSYGELVFSCLTFLVIVVHFL